MIFKVLGTPSRETWPLIYEQLEPKVHHKPSLNEKYAQYNLLLRPLLLTSLRPFILILSLSDPDHTHHSSLLHALPLPNPKRNPFTLLLSLLHHSPVISWR